jgi:hypothetical protein
MKKQQDATNLGDEVLQLDHPVRFPSSMVVENSPLPAP